MTVLARTAYRVRLRRSQLPIKSVRKRYPGDPKLDRDHLGPQIFEGNAHFVFETIFRVGDARALPQRGTDKLASEA